MFFFYFNGERISAMPLANYVLKIAEHFGVEVNNLKLQKILYYVQGCYLAKFGHPLFPEEIHAWKFGPAVPDVYYDFACFGSDPLHALEEPKMMNVLSAEELCLINQVIRCKLNISAMDLSRSTRNELPWLRATDDGRIIRLFQPISLEDMREFFETEGVNHV